MVVQFEQNRYTYSEGNSAASVCLELAALPAGGIEREIEITITTNNVTAGIVILSTLEQLHFCSVVYVVVAHVVVKQVM